MLDAVDVAIADDATPRSAVAGGQPRKVLNTTFDRRRFSGCEFLYETANNCHTDNTSSAAICHVSIQPLLHTTTHCSHYIITARSFLVTLIFVQQ